MEKLFILFSCLFCSYAFGWAIYKFGLQFELIDMPCERSSHCKPTPKGGGIGIFLSFLLLSFWFKVPISIWLPSSTIALMGFLGDRRNLHSTLRLFVQVLMALVFISIVIKNDKCYGYLIEIFKENNFLFYLTNLYLIIYIVGTTNFYNFMDGIDGIAGITGIFAFSLLGIYAYFHNKETELILVCFGIAISNVGFLVWNFPKAKIFMGDVGSTFLGFLFSILTIIFSTSIIDFTVMNSFLFLFYADEMVTMYERLKNKEKLNIAHRRHLYQILANEMGISHWKISVSFGFAQCLVGLLVWHFSNRNIFYSVYFIILLTCLFYTISYKIRRKYFRTG